ncbi:MAG: hypothetical protein M3Z25_16325 [Actinomycetota bacterium]|nr:hypothetical protein [Actinomycetota bacterium]
MRQLLAGLVGLLLTAAFAVAAGRGVGLSFRSPTGADAVSRTPGLVWLLAAGLFLGLLVLGRRLSPIVPLVAGALLLVATGVGLAAPTALGPGSPGGAAFGMHVLNGYGLGVLFATLLLVVAAVPARRRKPTSIS